MDRMKMTAKEGTDRGADRGMDGMKMKAKVGTEKRTKEWRE